MGPSTREPRTRDRRPNLEQVRIPPHLFSRELTRVRVRLTSQAVTKAGTTNRWIGYKETPGEPRFQRTNRTATAPRPRRRNKRHPPESTPTWTPEPSEDLSTLTGRPVPDDRSNTPPQNRKLPARPDRRYLSPRPVSRRPENSRATSAHPRTRGPRNRLNPHSHAATTGIQRTSTHHVRTRAEHAALPRARLAHTLGSAGTGHHPEGDRPQPRRPACWLAPALARQRDGGRRPCVTGPQPPSRARRSETGPGLVDCPDSQTSMRSGRS